MKTALQNIDCEEFYPKKLRGQIKAFNEKTAELQSELQAIPTKRQELARKVYACEIGGAEALATKQELAGLETAMMIDLARHIAGRAALNEPVQKACREEIEKQKSAIREREGAITSQLGQLGNPVLRQQTVQSDSIYRQLLLESRRLGQAAQMGATSGTAGHMDNAFLTEYQSAMRSVFGAVTSAAGGREVVSMFK